MLCTFGFVDDVTVVINGQAYVKLIVGMLIVIHQGQHRERSLLLTVALKL